MCQTQSGSAQAVRMTPPPPHTHTHTQSHTPVGVYSADVVLLVPLSQQDFDPAAVRVHMNLLDVFQVAKLVLPPPLRSAPNNDMRTVGHSRCVVRDPSFHDGGAGDVHARDGHLDSGRSLGRVKRAQLGE
jgi:hypothetical protein